MSLSAKAWLGLVCLALVMSVLLFAAAGTVHYWQGWLFLAIFFAAGLLHTLYAIKNDPALLERRLTGGPLAERGSAQRTIMVLSPSVSSGSLSCPHSAGDLDGARCRSLRYWPGTR